MKSLAAFALILFSLLLYVFLATQLGLYQRYPIIHFAGMAIGLFCLTRILLERFTIARLLLNIAGWTLTVFFVWWTLSYSRFEEHTPVVEIGKTANVMELTVQDEDNKATTLNAQLGESNFLLLAFYRGYW